MNPTETSTPSQPDSAGSPFDPDQAPEIWELALDDLSLQMTAQTFHAHLSGSRPRHWQPETNAWVIEVRNSYSPKWLSHRLDRVVRRALAAHTPGLPEPSLVYFASEQTPAAVRRERQQGAQSTAAAEHSNPVGEAGKDASGLPGDGGSRLAERDRATPAASQGATASQVGAQAAPARDNRPDSAAWKAKLQPTDIYIKLKTSFRERALRRLKGAKLSVFMSLILHMDAGGITAPGIERIMRETGHARGTVCRALDELASPPLSLIEKMPAAQSPRRRGCIRMADCYRIRGYAWWGAKPAPALYEEDAAM